MRLDDMNVDGGEGVIVSEDRTPAFTARGIVKWTVALALLLLLTLLLLFWNLTKAPNGFSTTSIKVEEGSTVREIAAQMETAGLAKNESVLYLVILYLHRNEPIKAGTFTFDEPLDVFELADFLTKVVPRDDLVRVTFPEGMRNSEYATIAEGALSGVEGSEFITLTEGKEGLLWPETYFVPADFTTKQLVDLMLNEHSEFVEEVNLDEASGDLTSTDIVTLASIVEREANSKESMRTVAGILLNRIKIDMPLQADATIEYILDEELGSLAPGELADKLKEVDSPYNTYLYRGLPPTPIGNPGAQAIEAVLNPTPSDYLFYITGNDGVFYYAKTFSEHQRNIALHL